uniref:uncharacterized protein C9orf85 homolog isoform X2 n=1 Tax=Myxine glutinosa TaxID=7769 RepID=UPI00358F5A90
MSSGSNRRRGQKYQNVTAFRNDKYRPNERLKKLNSLVHNGVCARCKSQLEWRIKFGKYKLLTQPSTCIKCLQKTVKTSYHKVCHACSIHLGLCAKCGCQGATEIPFASEEGPESIGVEQMQRKEDSSKLHSHSQCKGITAFAAGGASSLGARFCEHAGETATPCVDNVGSQASSTTLHCSHVFQLLDRFQA